MPTVETDLDKVQEKLHDNAVLWPRTELLRWYNDAYRDLLAKSSAVCRFLPLELPGRFSSTYFHDWEPRYITGTNWRASLPVHNTKRQSVYQWESEFFRWCSPYKFPGWNYSAMGKNIFIRD